MRTSRKLITQATEILQRLTTGNPDEVTEAQKEAIDLLAFAIKLHSEFVIWNDEQEYEDTGTSPFSYDTIRAVESMGGVKKVYDANTKRLQALDLDEDFLQMVTDIVNSIFLTMGAV